jgi:RNA ligase (TIGR02306 family)
MRYKGGEEIMDRVLASIQKVLAINAIPEAEKIEVATIQGWQVVVGKGDFKVGDLAVYFAVDSFLPITDSRYEFLHSRCKRKMETVEGLHLRTIRLKKQVSQGLLMSLNLFENELKSIPTFMDKEGVDMTELLNVKKFELPLPACLMGKARGNFPSFIRKTDEERIQSLPEFFNYYCDMEFEVSIKMDGSSCTYYLNDDVFGVCSRNIDLLETEGNTYWRIAREKKIEEKMREVVKSSSGFLRNFAHQGEMCGESIQSNRELIKGQDFFLFNVYDIDKREYLGYTMRKMVLEMMNMYHPEFQIQHVPVLGIMPILREYPNMKALLEYADGKGLNNDCREGIVCKSCDGRTSFKVISNKYLLKHGE